jgi:hypothetical protein
LPAVEIRSGFYHFRTRFRAGKSHGACVTRTTAYR